jgi:hypothetical protein
VSPFGKKDQGQPGGPDLQPELDRLGALDLRQLAAEVMAKGFGPDGPASDGLPTVSMIATAFVPGDSRGASDQIDLLHDIVWEGVQVLEHASLVRFAVWSSEGGKFFKLTRLGRAALEQGAVDRVLGGGTL